jgi:hypothetical protein
MFVFNTSKLNILNTYEPDTRLNAATITPVKDFVHPCHPLIQVILGGGQEVRDVTTTQARQGKFEACFYHKIFEDEIGRSKNKKKKRLKSHVPVYVGVAPPNRFKIRPGYRWGGVCFPSLLVQC